MIASADASSLLVDDPPKTIATAVNVLSVTRLNKEYNFVARNFDAYRLDLALNDAN